MLHNGLLRKKHVFYYFAKKKIAFVPLALVPRKKRYGGNEVAHTDAAAKLLDLAQMLVLQKKIYQLYAGQHFHARSNQVIAPCFHTDVSIIFR